MDSHFHGQTIANTFLSFWGFPNTAPATQNDSPKFQKHFSKTDETSITMRDRSETIPSWIRAGNRHPQPASQPRLLFRTTTSILYWKIQHFALRLSFQISPNTAPATKSDTSTSPNTAPATQNDSHHWSSWHVTRHLQCAAQQHSPSDLTKYCACHAKWNSWLISMTYETLFTMRGTTGGILQHHQILRLPRKMTVMTDPRHIWNAIYNARNNRWHPPTSPNTAPATQNDCHDWSSSHMKRYLQCAEQQVASSNVTKYCACHAKWFSKISETFLQNRWNVNYNARPIRDHSELDPSWIRAGNRHPQPASQPRLLFRTTTSILYWKIQHFALRLLFQISPNTAPATKSDTSTSPNTAPATQNDSHHWSSWHVTRHLQCAAQQHSPSDLTKYCACHAKWNSWLISMT